jgi:GT2 family glycosyltransferase
MAGTPRVRVIIVNYDGGEMTLQCLASLHDVDWPEEALEVVMVDNASIDGIAPRVKAEMPWVRVIEHTHNVGFAGGCNLGLAGFEEVDYVALLNNDAIPDPNWLKPLVDAFESDRTLGAACSKIVFAPSFVSIAIASPTFRPPGDGRDLGVNVTGVRVGDVDVTDDVQLAAGWHAAPGRRADGSQFWTSAESELRVPVDPQEPLPSRAALELSAETTKTVRLDARAEPVDVEVTPEPSWCEVPMGGQKFDVINNVGSRLVEGGYGGDRGFLERDDGQYEEPEDVFAWCGAAVLLSTRYLRDVGTFDDRYFVYYEDTDLSWRGRLAGWRYQYVPSSVVRHVHAATSREGSTLFMHYVERNRFLTLARNAPWPFVLDALVVFVRDTLVIARRDVLNPVLRRRGPDPRLTLRRIRVLFAFAKLLPVTLLSRWRQRRPRSVRERVVREWVVPR